MGKYVKILGWEQVPSLLEERNFQENSCLWTEHKLIQKDSGTILGWDGEYLGKLQAL